MAVGLVEVVELGVFGGGGDGRRGLLDEVRLLSVDIDDAVDSWNLCETTSGFNPRTEL